MDEKNVEQKDKSVNLTMKFGDMEELEMVLRRLSDNTNTIERKVVVKALKAITYFNYVEEGE